MSILQPSLAQKFIDKTAKDLQYNINIMNEKGIIIASKDSSRIGDFHEVAYGILNGTLESGVVRDNKIYIGTKPGVNMVISYKNKPAGVICVTGDPDTVSTFATLVKRSMEAMLEYEMQIEAEHHKKSKIDQFLYYLLFDQSITPTIACTLADSIGFNMKLLRSCIIVSYDADYSQKKIVQALTSAEGYSNQDIMTIAKNNDIIIFKSLTKDFSEAIREYRDIIQKYIYDFYKKLPNSYNKDKINIYVGTIQRAFDKYRYSYVHAQELELLTKEKSDIFFFNDFILDYNRNLVTIKTYDNIFNIYNELFDEEDQKQISETIDILAKNNYNIVNSAKALYIHRNTLLFRLNKIKDILNIDPISNSTDREFLNEFAYYFRQSNSKTITL